MKIIEKILVSLGLLTLIVLIILPALGNPSNCGGNSAALTVCHNYYTRILTYEAENIVVENIDDLDSEQKKNLFGYLHNTWIKKAKFFVRKKINRTEKEQIIIYCDTPYNNVPQEYFGESPYTYAAFTIGGNRKLLTKEEYNRLNKEDFIYSQEIYKEAVEQNTAP